MPDIEQHSQDQGMNVNARRDVHIHSGLTLLDARTLFMDLLASNFPNLRETALRAAEKRCEELFQSFWEKLAQQPKVDASAFERPDVQASIAETLISYAKAPTEDAGDILGDLLAKRVTLDPSDLKTLVINEALPVAAKLYQRHFDALSLVFLVKRTLFKMITVPELFGSLSSCLIPVGAELEITEPDVLYMQGVGALSAAAGQVTFSEALMQNYGQMFSWFEPATEEQRACFDRVKDLIVQLANADGVSPLVVPSEINPGQVRFHAPTQDDIIAASKQINDSVDRHFFERFARANQLGAAEVLVKLYSHDQRFAAVVENFQLLESPIPTLAGVAIGHANVIRHWPAFNSDLNSWIS